MYSLPGICIGFLIMLLFLSLVSFSGLCTFLFSTAAPSAVWFCCSLDAESPCGWTTLKPLFSRACCGNTVVMCSALHIQYKMHNASRKQTKKKTNNKAQWWLHHIEKQRLYSTLQQYSSMKSPGVNSSSSLDGSCLYHYNKSKHSMPDPWSSELHLNHFHINASTKRLSTDLKVLMYVLCVYIRCVFVCPTVKTSHTHSKKQPDLSKWGVFVH